jgi:hypothetical protein
MYKILFTLFAILLTFLVSDLLFEKANLYYELRWLDIPMHMLGGFLFASLFIYFSLYKKSNNKYLKINYKNIIIFVLFVGVVWEVYEYIHDIIRQVEWRGVGDTSKDLVNDIIGASIAFLLNKNKK